MSLSEQQYFVWNTAFQSTKRKTTNNARNLGRASPPCASRLRLWPSHCIFFMGENVRGVPVFVVRNRIRTRCFTSLAMRSREKRDFCTHWALCAELSMIGRYLFRPLDGFLVSTRCFCMKVFCFVKTKKGCQLTVCIFCSEYKRLCCCHHCDHRVQFEHC